MVSLHPAGSSPSFPFFNHSESPEHASDMLRVRRDLIAINKKLASFERGFLSDAGIKDREWYRHLGVAPGKWKVCDATKRAAYTY